MCDDERKLISGGPDPVAVVIAVEESFNITLPDAEAEKIRTMGQLYDYVYARVVRGQEQVCFTSAAFHRLRRALGEACQVPREQVRLQARLEDLIPLNDRARYWQELQARLGDLHLPCLRRPEWLIKRIEAAALLPMILIALCTILPAVLLKDIPAGDDTSAGLALAMIGIFACPFVGIPAMFLVYRKLCHRTKHYAVHIPLACATVRDLVYALVSGCRSPRMVSDTERANDKEIWGALCSIVGGELDRAPARFTRESTFV